jgi:hypothetical protein
VAGPVENAYGTTVSLFEMAEENPAAWVAPAMVKAPDEDVLATVLDPRFNIRSVALFDTAAAVQGVELSSMPVPLPIRATVTRPGPGSIDVALDQPAPDGSALVVSENYYPGWAATVDGQPAAIGRADVSLIGVPLPAGTRQVSLRFSSEPYETGTTVTLVAVLVALLWVVGGAVVERRRRA